ncbi:hypothetical protein [Anaerocolumna chitinilytica]|uniref:Uncharacterized protein n=1 Tax=Anaerocolumna chitinilytica TaxID=1727145 RepID=A0A7I8DTT8_9FIRM|nr:hypothetical protein [Anaerocolumna chitinilytica]BCJ99706.1 hypothetical protein bsdcttw_27470 [Anaerocolumna chitinilytica]
MNKKKYGLIIFIVFFMILLFFSSSDHNLNNKISREKEHNINTKYTYNNEENTILNDLVYHQYESGIVVDTNSILTIESEDLYEYGIEYNFYLLDHKNKELVKLNYNDNNNISYEVLENGAYSIYAYNKDKNELIDLSSKIKVGTNYSTSNNYKIK